MSSKQKNVSEDDELDSKIHHLRVAKEMVAKLYSNIRRDLKNKKNEDKRNRLS